MRTVEECLDDLQEDSYAYTTTLIEFMDEDLVEGLLKAICQAVEINNAASLPFFAQSLGQAVNDAMSERAVAMQTKTKNPLLEAFDEIMSGFPTIHKDAA